MTDGPSEFWQEEAREGQRDLRRVVLRWAIVFGLLLAALAFVLWWASSAVEFTTSRVRQDTQATYRVSGAVRDARTGKPIPWAHLADDPAGRPPHYEAWGDFHGNFEFETIAEPHTVNVRAFAYKPTRVTVGKRWYLWMPSGEERIVVKLEPER